MSGVALLGVGRLGEAVLVGLLGAGHDVADVVGAEASASRAQKMTDAHGVRMTSPAAAVADAETVLIVVKPHDVLPLCEDLGPVLAPGALVVSLAAGISCAALEGALPTDTPVVRVMTNTPLLVGQAMSALAAGSTATAAHLERVRSLLEPVGRVVTVPEGQLDAVTALSGSGPAYVFAIVEALIEGGVLLGLPRPLATELAVQTLVGSGAMLEGGTHPALLREGVTSPGGTTAKALQVLAERGVPAAFLSALEAARDRSIELSGS